MKKYGILFLSIMSTVVAMQSRIITDSEIMALGFMNFALLDCVPKNDSQKARTHAQIRLKKIDLAIQCSPYKNHKSGDHREALLRIGRQLPTDIQRHIFSYVFCREVDKQFFQENSITSVLNMYLECNEYNEIYDNKFLLTRAGRYFTTGFYYSGMIIDCDQFRSLTVNELVLLRRIIKGNIIAAYDKDYKPEVSILDEIKGRSPVLYTIKATEIPTAHSLLTHQFSYRLIVSQQPIFTQKDLAADLKINIEYDGPTIKDRALIFIPCALSALSPDVLCCAVNYGSSLLVPGGGWLWYLPAAAGHLLVLYTCFNVPVYTNNDIGCLIGDKIFPFFEKRCTWVAQLKNFFGDNVKNEDKRGFKFRVNFWNYLSAVLSYTFVVTPNILCLVAGACLYGLRLASNYLFFEGLVLKQPVKRGTPRLEQIHSPMVSEKWSHFPYTLRYMENRLVKK